MATNVSDLRNMDHSDDAFNFAALCRGEEMRSRVLLDSLSCWLDSGSHPWLRIQVTEEWPGDHTKVLLAASQGGAGAQTARYMALPRCHQVGETSCPTTPVSSAGDLEDIKDTAKPLLARSQVEDGLQASISYISGLYR